MAECYTIKGLCTLRATRLDPVTGAVVAPPDNVAVTESQVFLQLTADVEEGTEETQKNGCGKILASDKSEDIFKRWNLELSLGNFEPALLEILSGAEVHNDGGGEPIGIIGADELDPSFVRPLSALEVWFKLFDGDAQAGTLPWGYLLLTATRWRIGDARFGEEFTPLPLVGNSQTNSLWGNGPHDDTGFDAAVRTWALVGLDQDPPTAVCGYADVEAGS